MQDLAVGFRASAPTLEIKSPASAALSAAPVKWVKLLQLSIRSGAQEPVLETEIRISENLSTVCGSCVQITPSERMGRAELRPPEAAAWSLDLAVLRAILDGEPNPVSAKRASRALCAKFRSAAMGVGVAPDRLTGGVSWAHCARPRLPSGGLCALHRPDLRPGSSIRGETCECMLGCRMCAAQLTQAEPGSTTVSAAPACQHHLWWWANQAASCGVRPGHNQLCPCQSRRACPPTVVLQAARAPHSSHTAHALHECCWGQWRGQSGE